ncbi:MAG: hypothetical protein QM714_14780 [Nocardioides sp.]|uniref:hypothetical protein n=1 Tax=Nocardioides sp. TaxID=35761 RepID=UPI0039E2F5B2
MAAASMTCATVVKLGSTGACACRLGSAAGATGSSVLSQGHHGASHHPGRHSDAGGQSAVASPQPHDLHGACGGRICFGKDRGTGGDKKVAAHGIDLAAGGEQTIEIGTGLSGVHDVS